MALLLQPALTWLQTAATTNKLAAQLEGGQDVPGGATAGVTTLMDATAGAGDVSAVVDATAHSADISTIVDVFCEPLLAYMQRKRRKTGNQAVGESKHGQTHSQTHGQTCPQGSQSSSIASSGLSDAAVKSLHLHAVAVLKICLMHKPLSCDVLDKVMTKLLPPLGWSTGIDYSQEPVASNEEQVELASWIIQQQVSMFCIIDTIDCMMWWLLLILNQALVCEADHVMVYCSSLVQ